MPDVVALVAGLAGHNSPEDEVWAAEFTACDELTCPRLHVNDAVIAHAGAFVSRPGIVVIAGTGSIIFGVTEAGRQVRNYDFHHAPATAARYLAYNAVHRLLAGEVAGDDAFLAEVLAYWQVVDLRALREMGLFGFVADRFERDRRFGEMAPLVTAAAERGSPVARQICDQAAEALGVGVRLIGGCFLSESVPVAFIGGAVGSTYLRRALESTLMRAEKPRFVIEEPVFSSAVGAIIMALQNCGTRIDDAVASNLCVWP
jgi:glucosamine kinase